MGKKRRKSVKWYLEFIKTARGKLNKDLKYYKSLWRSVKWVERKFKERLLIKWIRVIKLIRIEGLRS